MDERQLSARIGKEYLVRWEHYGPEHDTWEKAAGLGAGEAVDMWIRHKKAAEDSEDDAMDTQDNE